MKFTINLLLTVVSLSIIGCSAAKTTTQNANVAWQNSTEMTATNTPTPAPTAENQTPKIAPDALVKDLYKQHDADKSPFFQKKSRALVDKYFSKSLADTIWKEANEPRDGIGALEADPLYSAQDTDIKNFVANQPKITGDKAEVVVTFDNFKEKEKFTYLLVKENGEWKISDINYGDLTLQGIYKEYNQSEANPETTAGEFEGKYQVGDTTCTVKPIKMAFEVKWKQGTGTEIFFLDDNDSNKINFSSSNNPGQGAPNTFSFDDQNYDTGTFYRADGKEFPIKRIK